MMRALFVVAVVAYGLFAAGSTLAAWQWTGARGFGVADRISGSLAIGLVAAPIFAVFSAGYRAGTPASASVGTKQ